MPSGTSKPNTQKKQFPTIFVGAAFTYALMLLATRTPLPGLAAVDFIANGAEFAFAQPFDIQKILDL